LKWYKPTSLGKWLILFLKPPKEISQDLTKSVIEELFHLYSFSIVEAAHRYGLDVESFHQNLDKEYIMESIRRQIHTEPEVVVVGSAALDVYGHVDDLPTPDEITYVESIGCHPGGMGANVAVALSKLNIKVSIFCKIGKDSAGRILLENLIQSNVDTTDIKIAEGSSLKTLILKNNKNRRWIYTIGGSQSAISLTSPDEINWRALEQSKIIYIGEVFKEIASTIADYANTKGKLVVFRPGSPYMNYGIEGLGRILENSTYFILNQPSWERLKMASTQLQTPADLNRIGVEYTLLTKGDLGCELFSEKKHKIFPVDTRLESNLKLVDSTGAGDSFSAAFMKGLLNDWNIERSVEYAQVAAAITCSRFGTSQAFPTEDEIEVAMSSA
jgi:ribokinase